MKALHTIEANPANTTLIIVNMQNEFCKAGGALFDEMSTSAMPAVISAARTLLDTARAAGISIIHVQSLRDQQGPQFTLFGEKPMLKPGAWNSDIAGELAPLPSEVIVRAWSEDPFHKTRLDHIVSGLGPVPTGHQVIVAGGHINGALYFVVDRLYLMGYWTVLPLDAVYGDAEGMDFGVQLFSKPSFPNIFFTRSDKVAASAVAAPGVRGLVPRM